MSYFLGKPQFHVQFMMNVNVLSIPASFLEYPRFESHTASYPHRILFAVSSTPSK
jgi:hypothetical protein